MKRRDIEAERARWSTHALFVRGRRLRRARSWLKGLVCGALGFGAAVAIAVIAFGPSADVALAWTTP